MTSMVGSGFLAALLFLGTLVAFQLTFARRRRDRFTNLDLRPNVLLTRYPIVFIGRPRSLFRLAGDFLELPLYLAEHGYRVEEVEMPTDNSGRFSLVRLLESSSEPLHLFISPAFTGDALDLALDGHPRLQSMTLFAPLKRRSREQELIPYRVPVFERRDLHPSVAAGSFKIESRALDHVVSLAEQDLR